MVTKTRLRGVAAFAIFVSVNASDVAACSRRGPFTFEELFGPAELIVRATAVKYASPPTSEWRTTGQAESTVEFQVEEVLRGEAIKSVVLHGYLGQKDDFNDVPMPYSFVRPTGRSGSCFANTYKQGAQYLLFLRKSGEVWTSNISALGPSNEQLHDADDPWVWWVKGVIFGRGQK
jgi:hypothetical protein